MIGPRQHNRCVILVVGMHRSGTSALTAALAQTGARLPLNLLPPRDDNQDGFFEPEDIVALHDEVLAAAGSAWDDAAPWAASQLDAIRDMRFRRRLWDLLRPELPGIGALLVKDPRLCRLLPLWHDLAAERGLELRHVLAVRHPIEVAASLDVRNGMAMLPALDLWARSYLDAERSTRGRPRIVASYDAVLREKSRCVLPLARALGIVPLSPPREIAASIDAVLRDDRRHHRAPRGDGPPHAALAIYDWLMNGLHPDVCPA